jgi:hypothetical protein
MKVTLCVSLDGPTGLAGEFRGLLFEMPGNLLVEPALESGGEVKDFEGHGFGPSSSQKLAVRTVGGLK